MGLGDSSQKSDTLSSALQGNLVVGTTAVQVKVGGSNLTNRQMIRIYNDSSATIYMGFTSGVTTSGTTRGEELFKKQGMTIMLTEDQSLFAIAGSAGNNVLVSEYA